jgi:hypothetical protein
VPAIVVVCSLTLIGASATAKPDLRSGRPAGALTVFPDDRRAGLFYYAPGGLAVALAADGEPEVHFLQARYTGTAATGDRGVTVFRSVLSFRVLLSGPMPRELAAANDALARAVGPAAVELRPLPIRRLDAAVLFAPAGGTGQSKPPQVLPPGHFEETGEHAEGYWRERSYAVGMDPDTAQLFSEALDRGQVALSVAYAFYADGIGPDHPVEELKGSPELVAELRKQMGGRDPGAEKSDTEGGPHLVRAGAIGITADGRRRRDLVRHIDINETAPPGYAAVEVYCYDFNNDLRPDLYEKQVEIEARAVGGAPVTLLAAFRRDRPDLYARTGSFSVAVRLDLPYRYRLIEIALDGHTAVGPWQKGQSWNGILDVTTRPEGARAGVRDP